MNKLRVVFFFGLLALVIIIARHNSRSIAQSAKLAPSPTPQVAANSTPAAANSTPAAPVATPQVASQSPVPAPTAPIAPQLPVDFKKIADRITPAVALISTFDPSGKLLHSGSGCFVSSDGRLLTTFDMVQGAAHAVAKVSDGRILNVSGILANAAAVDLAVVKADTKKGVPFVAPNKSPQNGGAVAVVGSTLSHREPSYFERSIAARGSDAAGDWVGLSAAVPADCIGAPLVNGKGELVGLLTSQHMQGALANIARTNNAVDSIVAGINPQAEPSWQVADNDTASPSEGPTATPTRTVKIPLVQAEQQGATRLIYTPRPKYPNEARRSTTPLQGAGRYRIRFAANGLVQEVQILESTHNPALDSAATETLRRWKAEPGHEWSATVPITFQP